MNQRTLNKTELYKIILSLKSLREAELFFHDLLTPEEIEDFAKRWQVVKMLNAGMSYADIQKATSLSSTTVARTSKWVKKGGGGFLLALKRAKKSTSRKVK
ncbi:MAG: YerC/YecD family TrpR-related protein [Patescibacteria group bacterium]|nr:YerC/YecD family TrpR-related protein [Patescibacteria group bacterium]